MVDVDPTQLTRRERRKLEVRTRIVEAAVAIADAEEGYLLLVDEQTNELYIRSALNLGESLARGFRQRVGDGISGRVVRDGQSVMYNNIDDTNRFKLKTGYLVKALINVPLYTKDKIIRIVVVFPAPFGPRKP